jgi:predicted ATP-grasp superfamily ATP-dependent carboligase
MRVFIYEFMTGGGWFHLEDRPPAGPLLTEGRAMLEAVATDFAAIANVKVTTLRDKRVPGFRIPDSVEVRLISPSKRGVDQFEELVRNADAVLVIAPELDKHLWRHIQCAEFYGGKLLSPSPKFVELAGDKWQTHQRLSKAGVPTPKTRLQRRDKPWKRSNDLQVVKPIDGCGSLCMGLLLPQTDFDWTNFPGPAAVVQEYCPGTAASVALLCGSEARYGLAACQQTLSEDCEFRYLGGACPLTDSLNLRAQELALCAVRALAPLPEALGYVGVDLILGEAEDGSQDYVIEINPRLTTSYVGLRALSNTNLAQAMLDVAQGREPQLNWKPGRVRWTASGEVEYLEA